MGTDKYEDYGSQHAGSTDLSETGTEHRSRSLSAPIPQSGVYGPLVAPLTTLTMIFVSFDTSVAVSECVSGLSHRP